MSLFKSIIAVYLISLFLTPFQASAQVLSDNNSNLPGIWSGSTAWGDYDADGDPDLLITGLTGPAENCVPIARIYRNTAGTFTDINADLPPIYLGKAAWGDYDGDGDLDVAISGFQATGNSITRIYRNDNGIFTLDTDQNMVSLRYSNVAWGDYDADGDLDLLTSGMTTGGTVSTVLYKNGRIDRTRTGSPLGGRSVLEEDVFNTGSIVNVNKGNMAWGDIDNDGDLDLAISGYGSGDVRQSQIYLNNPLGTLLRDERSSDLIPVSQGDLSWGDYDTDGDIDLLLSGWSNGWEATLNLYTNAAGILTENTFFSTTRIIGAVAWGDYDNDGDLDIATAGQNSASDRFTFILQNNWDRGAFIEDTAQNLEGLRGGDIAWADIDNDGDLDVLVTGENEQGIRKTTLNASNNVSVTNIAPLPPTRLGTPLVTSNGVTLNWNDGIDAQSSSLALSYILRIGTTPGANNVFSGALPTGQSNMSNRKTVQLSIPLARDTYYWSVRAVDGGLLTSDESQEDLFRVQDLVNSTHVLRQLQNSALALADYDNDGDLDLAISGRDGDGIARSFIYSNTFNLLSENTNIGLQGAHTGDLAWGDYDNDGDLDLALTGGDDAGNRFTHLYRNRLETKDFALNIANVSNLPQVTSSSVAWGDYDNDGDLDLALMGNASGTRTAGIFRNDNGTLTQDTNQTLTPTDNGKLTWGDLDNDGDLDLATMGQINDANEAAFSLYTNTNGNLTFDTRSTVTGLLASSMALGDYDNDGDLDLATTGFNIASGLFTNLYSNDNTGLFTQTNITGLTPAAASDLSWGDYDNDGDLDLAFVGQSATGLLLQVLRYQDNTFTNVPVDILPGMDFASVLWGDYDSDGDLDLFSAGRTTTDGTTFPPITRV
ncbi:MAG: VCBS repeat-containing protein, partial [Candidatus Latescibacteria bacterium]|nr:VCBS repeat-containing protein [Candidatus Latescibacterota bacterium]